MADAAKWLAPSLWSAACLQCSLIFTALIYAGPPGPTLALFPQSHGGLTTPNTPPSVAYYLDQAYRAQSVSAYSAAVSMYRAALEPLLFGQGLTSGTCGQKLAALETAIENGTPPTWARDLDIRYLRVLKDLGNSAIHPNDGDVLRQAVLDQELVTHVMATFVELLDQVYEAPIEKASRLKALEAKRDQVSAPKIT